MFLTRSVTKTLKSHGVLVGPPNSFVPNDGRRGAGVRQNLSHKDSTPSS